LPIHQLESPFIKKGISEYEKKHDSCRICFSRVPPAIDEEHHYQNRLCHFDGQIKGVQSSMAGIAKEKPQGNGE